MALSNHCSVARLAASAIIGTLLLITTAGVPAAQAAGAGGSDILPHRATYKMSLQSARNGSKVADVRGQMSFEWADACDGWTTEQRFQLRFVYAEGEEMNMATNYVTWESKDGLHYRFNVRKTVNGELDEDVSGDAMLDKGGSGGTAVFARPEPMELSLPAGTMFPTAHTLALLDNAKTGGNFFVRTIFDGADDDGVTEVSAVIGKAEPVDKAIHEKFGKTVKLDGQSSLPVRMAFFPAQSDSAQPEYEMSLRLLKNGIAESMQIDYGDFAMQAILDKLEPLPKSGC